MSIRSIRTRSRKQDIFNKPLQRSSNPYVSVIAFYLGTLKVYVQKSQVSNFRHLFSNCLTVRSVSTFLNDRLNVSPNRLPSSDLHCRPYKLDRWTGLLLELFHFLELCFELLRLYFLCEDKIYDITVGCQLFCAFKRPKTCKITVTLRDKGQHQFFTRSLLFFKIWPLKFNVRA